MYEAPVLFHDTPKAEDPLQGGLGDCWFIAGMYKPCPWTLLSCP